MYVGLLVKRLLCLSHFDQTWTLPTEFRKKKNHSNIKFHQKSVQWESSCSMRTDRQTDTTKLTGAFRNFVEVTWTIQVTAGYCRIALNTLITYPRIPQTLKILKIPVYFYARRYRYALFESSDAPSLFVFLTKLALIRRWVWSTGGCHWQI